MSIDKFGKPISREEAEELIKNEGFLLDYLPEYLKKDRGLQKLASNWWLDHIVEKILFLREHPEEMEKILKAAKEKGLIE